MAEPAELVQGIFSLVVSVVVIGLVLVAIGGGDISRIATTFADVMPAFVVLLIGLFLILKAVQSF